MSAARRHHYLPQFYLRGFCRNESFWIFDRHRGEFRIQTPINTTVQTDYYAFKRQDGSLDPMLEKLLSRVETIAAPAIAKANEGGFLSKGEKQTLSLFAGLQKTRVPDFEKIHDEIRKGILGRLGDNVAPVTEQELRDAPSVVPPDDAGPRVSAYELVQDLKRMQRDPDLAHGDFLRMILPVAKTISEALMKMSWVVAHSPPSTAFITTDCPFQTMPPPNYDPHGLIGYGIGTPGAVKVMSLSSKSCLLILDEGTAFAHAAVDGQFVHEVNLALALTCDNYLIAGEEQQAKDLVERSGIDEGKKGPRLVIQ